jgi:GNAT superfamily N-acetyltransferase
MANFVVEAPRVTESTSKVVISIGNSSVEGTIYKNELKVEELWVAPEVRSHGIGMKLMTELVNWCKGKGIKYLTGVDASDNGESTRIRRKLPGQFFTLRRREEKDPQLDLFPDAPNRLRETLKNYLPDPNGRWLVNKLARLLK